MKEITPALVKELRDRTGVGMAKCKEALQQASGDIELAIANLRKAGLASAAKKEGRETNEGTIQTGVAPTNVALVEVNAETDFVVKNDKFQEFAKNLAEAASQTAPSSLENFIKQKYPNDPNLTIDEYRSLIVQSLGENIQIRRLKLLPKKSDSSLGVYSHSGGKLVTVVEIAGSGDEEALARDIAMHVAAESPDYLSSEDVPDNVLAHEKEIARAQIKNKPENILDKIVEGKLKAYFDQVCLLRQQFVKDTNLTIQELVEKRAKEIGKPLKVIQFLRWRVGE